MLAPALQTIIVTKYFGAEAAARYRRAADSAGNFRRCFNIFRSGAIEIHRYANENLLHCGEARFLVALGK
jgi:hypothetical protein